MTTEEISVHIFDGTPQKERMCQRKADCLPINCTTGAGFPVSGVSTIVSDTKTISSFMTWASFFPMENELVITLSSY